MFNFIKTSFLANFQKPTAALGPEPRSTEFLEPKPAKSAKPTLRAGLLRNTTLRYGLFSPRKTVKAASGGASVASTALTPSNADPPTLSRVASTKAVAVSSSPSVRHPRSPIPTLGQSPLAPELVRWMASTSPLQKAQVTRHHRPLGLPHPSESPPRRLPTDTGVPQTPQRPDRVPSNPHPTAITPTRTPGTPSAGDRYPPSSRTRGRRGRRSSIHGLNTISAPLLKREAEPAELLAEPLVPREVKPPSGIFYVRVVRLEYIGVSKSPAFQCTMEVGGQSFSTDIVNAQKVERGVHVAQFSDVFVFDILHPFTFKLTVQPKPLNRSVSVASPASPMGPPGRPVDKRLARLHRPSQASLNSPDSTIPGSPPSPCTSTSSSGTSRFSTPTKWFQSLANRRSRSEGQVLSELYLDFGFRRLNKETKTYNMPLLYLSSSEMLKRSLEVTLELGVVIEHDPFRSDGRYSFPAKPWLRANGYTDSVRGPNGDRSRPSYGQASPHHAASPHPNTASPTTPSLSSALPGVISPRCARRLSPGGNHDPRESLTPVPAMPALAPTQFTGHLSIFVRSGRGAAWKRYWATMDHHALVLYHPEHRDGRPKCGRISLVHLHRVLTPTSEVINLGPYGLELAFSPLAMTDKQRRQSAFPHPLEIRAARQVLLQESAIVSTTVALEGPAGAPVSAPSSTGAAPAASPNTSPVSNHSELTMFDEQLDLDDLAGQMNLSEEDTRTFYSSWLMRVYVLADDARSKAEWQAKLDREIDVIRELTAWEKRRDSYLVTHTGAVPPRTPRRRGGWRGSDRFSQVTSTLSTAPSCDSLRVAPPLGTGGAVHGPPPQTSLTLADPTTVGDLVGDHDPSRSNRAFSRLAIPSPLAGRRHKPQSGLGLSGSPSNTTSGTSSSTRRTRNVTTPHCLPGIHERLGTRMGTPLSNVTSMLDDDSSPGATPERPGSDLTDGTDVAKPDTPSRTAVASPRQRASIHLDRLSIDANLAHLSLGVDTELLLQTSRASKYKQEIVQALDRIDQNLRTRRRQRREASPADLLPIEPESTRSIGQPSSSSAELSDEGIDLAPELPSVTAMPGDASFDLFHAAHLSRADPTTKSSSEAATTRADEEDDAGSTECESSQSTLGAAQGRLLTPSASRSPTTAAAVVAAQELVDRLLADAAPLDLTSRNELVTTPAACHSTPSAIEVTTPTRSAARLPEATRGLSPITSSGLSPGKYPAALSAAEAMASPVSKVLFPGKDKQRLGSLGKLGRRLPSRSSIVSFHKDARPADDTESVFEDSPRRLADSGKVSRRFLFVWNSHQP
ncbi:hypothetical protein IWQ60_003613 [Tieghemiomyces parasiticus]|uniref:PH domain-containing protein n=1 Tax=Tieghemiomyces parasiticus TaxID=78921 RepID=A0A9W8DWB0_9FUNG|nr:hypothetical protein IWQ60_003613 [Tieghemiomyces parasiticus]